MRPDGRSADALRQLSLEPGFSKFAEGSCLIKIGETHMLVTASVEDRVPPFMKGKGSGWLTAEYSMLARSGRQRNSRDPMKPNGRSMEIQRLIGRALRTAIDLEALGERTITLDCDAIQADGGTRCAAITAGYVATYQAVQWMMKQRMLKANVMREPIAAVSVGIYRGLEVLDLNYDEDSTAGTDMNVVMAESQKFIEIQGTAEAEPFGVEALAKMLKLAQKGINELIQAQKDCLS
jgi:ribonuclease PH